MGEKLAEGVFRLELPSHTLPPFSHTNSYLIAEGGVAMLIDPGFHESESLNQVKAMLEQTQSHFLKGILLTHTHSDHCEGLALMQETFSDAAIYVHPNEYARVEEHKNVQALNHERTLMIGDKALKAIFTPGHSPGHLSFYLDEIGIAFVGDMVAGQGSTWIGLPEGSIADYIKSIDTLRSLKLKQLAPGHGEVIKEPYNKLNEVRQHRIDRLEQVRTALDEGQLKLPDIRKKVYPDLHPNLTELADRSLLALIKKLMNDMQVLHLGTDESGPYALRK